MQALLGDFAEIGFEFGGKAREGIAVCRLEGATGAGGVLDHAGQRVIGAREIGDSGGGTVGELGDVGGENTEILAFVDDAGGDDASVDGDDAHHLHGAPQIGDRVGGAGERGDEAVEIALFGPERHGDLAGAAADHREPVGGFGELGAFEIGGQGFEGLGEARQDFGALGEAAADIDEGAIDGVAGGGEVLGEGEEVVA